ncbi:sigma-54-dependent Fis family transcriptional regulator [bacterium]|nr:sigma-54-dependent Fis family transcriptional regulator [bacterium]
MDIKRGKVLVVDDDEDVLHAAQLFLKQHILLVQTERDPGKIPTLMRQENFDVILLDMNFTRDMTSGQEGIHWLQKILTLDPAAVVVLITAYGDVSLAVQAMKEGASDFVLKPWQNEKLLATLSAALNLRQSRLEIDNLRSRQQVLSADLDLPFTEFIGSSQPVQKLFSTIEKVARTNANVLLLGENGTGKELVARALHRKSSRAAEVFISVDMGAISETLFESELFGHVKGAFTDAKTDRRGRFELASGGTLFLDEIGNLTLGLQSKILKALETRQITPVGSNKFIDIDIRLICATNVPIHEMVAHNEFRQDLLYRINTVEIFLPPLRERAEDIPLLVDHFLKNYARKYSKKVQGVSATTMKKLLSYHWPGNVRELKHALERAIIMSESALLQPDDFFFPNKDIRDEKLIIKNYNLDEVEKSVIQKALDKYLGNISKTAQELGLTRASLYRRMEKHGL